MLKDDQPVSYALLNFFRDDICKKGNFAGRGD